MGDGSCISNDGTAHDGFVVAFSSAGDARAWLLDSSSDSIANAKDGSVYLRGPLRGWVQTFDGWAVFAITASADGGVLAAGNGWNMSHVPEKFFIAKPNGDSTSASTVGAGGLDTPALAIKIGNAGFTVAGLASGSADYDPGVGKDTVTSNRSLRFAIRFLTSQDRAANGCACIAHDSATSVPNVHEGECYADEPVPGSRNLPTILSLDPLLEKRNPFVSWQ